MRPSVPSSDGGASGQPPVEGGFLIDIDPALIEAAVASVERRLAVDDQAEDQVEVDLSVAEPAAPREETPQRGAKLFEEEVDELVVPPELADLLGDDGAPDEDPVGPEGGAPQPGLAAPDPLLLARLEMQTVQIIRLENQTRELLVGRETLAGQVRELRQGASELSADFDRYRQRARKERDDAERRGEERLLVPLLDTADNLERAWAHAPSDGGQLARGLHMVLEQLRSQLKRLGVERISGARGQVFDPEIHEALQRVPTRAEPPGHIVDEIAPGYRFHGRLLRPARVTVAAEPPATSPSPLADPPLAEPGVGGTDAY